jgi:hypothetical protein
VIGRVLPRGGRSQAAALLGHPRFEVFPAAGIAGQLAEHLPPGAIAGLHLFTFNQLSQALDWRRTLVRPE